MKKLYGLLLVVVSFFVTPALAVDGNALYQWGVRWKQGDPQDVRDAGAFSGYIQGFIDLHTDLSDPEIAMLKTRLFCVPSGVQSDQVRNVVFGYIDAHPEKRNFTAASLVSVALWQAFPCD